MALEDNPNYVHAEFEYSVTGGAGRSVLVVYTDLDLDPAAGTKGAVEALVAAAKGAAGGADIRIVNAGDDDDD
ncbi:MAG: hypothetical protein ABWZ40_05340 [Caulobacterales bacterium]